MDKFKDPEGAYVGTCPWAYGGIYRPETQHANAFGDVWAGDPPHESPGWYDLYDTDEAMNIVHRQQLDIAAFLHDGKDGHGKGHKGGQHGGKGDDDDCDD
jgi:mannan endo-1,4-beta-mannosidase